ncbi:hypothetical protein GSI_02540 [Ganoderma sinense ZZ0214-1]|uniref:Peptidase A1 domain-containing protein n=1 Tax=Ganoderma sinense ZZ0214-1 TaxID=1077348 RepID=A0A2G8SM05_9APHY|nr:hypothetical protein GSI_02540 [Ganoderma sinense ZZ0214-1]
MPLPRKTQLQDAPRWKGKERDVSGRDEGDGASDGIVIDLTLITDSQYQSTYVAPIFLGQGLSKHYVQVDTGSSDLWLASTACSSSTCNAVSGERYDPSASQPTGQSIQITYAEGEADGPIVWDAVQLGGYSIDHQALIAASTVNNEPLSSQFNGVMGLALSSNSVIARQLPTATNDVPDGATLSSNLFSITPLGTAPGARFFSLTLERPGSDRVPSVLGIGRHPESLITDPSKIQYAPVSPSGYGTLFWQASITAITVYVDGQPKPVSLPTSVVPAAKAPSAILDSGVPLIVTTTEIANGIYGAMGVGPANDGNYYIPCTTPLNVSFVLDSRSELFLHPLDLTTYPPNDASSETCIGLIQTPASLPGLNFGTTADMVLGVPFLRNAYFVMAYDPPFPNGTFPSNSVNSYSVDAVRPRLGLLNITNPVTAADEFHQVRVLKSPLNNSHAPATSHSKGLSVGVEVLIGLLGFFGLCAVLFASRWVYMRRKYKRERAATAAFNGDYKDPAYVMSALGYKPRPGEPTEDELRQRRFEAYKRRHMNSQYTDDTVLTRVEDTPYDKGGATDEFGALKVPPTPGTPLADYFDPWGDTLVTSPTPDDPQTPLASLLPPPRTARRSLSPRSAHHRTFSGGPSPDVPLLAHTRMDSNQSVHLRDSDIAEFGFGTELPPTPNSMAGIGRRRFSSLGGSTLGSPHEEHEYFSPRTPSYYSSHARTGSAASASVSASVNPRESQSLSPLSTPSVAVPLPAIAVEPAVAEYVMDTSLNNSRASVIGHES